ncbi:S49 family peptidase [Pseudolabrys sp. Root1462]|uniref:S49 family peptidase n=1 Tax=Pseudolabrys sp. Root1462 TaxID=1736466 RepID=UPI000A45B6F0|nr:S49 family peptidase [Pseudolabrys sp. Root1462]
MAALNFLMPPRFRSDIPVVPVVRLTGVIGATTPLRPGMTLAGLARTLDRAFAVPRARAVALLINSPGGSPTQSHLIFRRIRQLAEEKKVTVLAFIEDAGASGGYMLACAGDEIICDDFSIVGSIGVVGGTFGFPELMKKLGIERRVYTAGDRKVMLDPFQEEKPEDVQRIKAIQADMHEHFIDLVKKRRGARLSGADTILFSGEFWTAARAIELGLVDGRGDLRSILRERYGDKVRMPVIAGERSFLARRLSLAGLFGGPGRAGFADEIISALDERTLWSRYGL